MKTARCHDNANLATAESTVQCRLPHFPTMITIKFIYCLLDHTFSNQCHEDTFRFNHSFSCMKTARCHDNANLATAESTVQCRLPHFPTHHPFSGLHSSLSLSSLPILVPLTLHSHPLHSPLSSLHSPLHCPPRHSPISSSPLSPS